jgi:hypothetical protein
MSDEVQKPTRLLEPLATLYASGVTLREASRQIGCSEKQAGRIAASEAFRTRVSEIRSEITGRVVGRLTASSEAAAERLEALLAADKPQVSLAACKAILAALKPQSELHELRARLDALEAEIRGK